MPSSSKPSSCSISSVLASSASALEANVPRDSNQAPKTLREAPAPPRHRYAAHRRPCANRRPRVPCSLWQHRARGATRTPQPRKLAGPTRDHDSEPGTPGTLPQDRQVAPCAPSRAVGRGRRAGLRGHTETEARRRRRGQRENEGHSPASAQSTPCTGSSRSPVARVRKQEWHEVFPLAEGAHVAGSGRGCVSAV